MTVGVLHPGEMGAAIGARLRAGGETVLWASAGRSPAATLVAEWRLSQPQLDEMEEIARSFAATGLPAGFDDAAAEVYRHVGYPRR